MKRQTQFNSQEQQQDAQQQQQEQQAQQSAALEFGSAEEMLRHDASRTPVPPGIWRRLRDSLAQLPAAHASWWRRLLGGS
jgi:transcription initiation factor TFIID subunit TAF12